MALGSVVAVPVSSPHFAARLSAFAALVAGPDGGTVVPLTVVPRDADDARLDDARELVGGAERAASVIGVRAGGLVTGCASIAGGVGEAMAEAGATAVVMGWRGPDARGNVFGRLVDAVLGGSTVPLLIVRPGDAPFTGVVLPVADDQLSAEHGVLELGVAVARRVAAGRGVPLAVAHNGAETERPEELRDLGTWLHHDAPDVHEAMVATAGEGDLIVVPVTTTEEGLQRAASLLARVDPRSWVVLAIDAGAARRQELGGIVAGAADRRAALSAPTMKPLPYAMVVTIRHPSGRPVDPEVVERVLSGAGAAVEEHRVTDELRLRVIISAAGANAAVAAVLTALHDAEELDRADISYEVAAAADRLLEI
jgi:hypothetical protein